MARKLYSTRTGQMDFNGLLSQGEPLQRHLIRKRKSRLDKGVWDGAAEAQYHAWGIWSRGG